MVNKKKNKTVWGVSLPLSHFSIGLLLTLDTQPLDLCFVGPSGASLQVHKDQDYFEALSFEAYSIVCLDKKKNHQLNSHE